MKIDDEKEEIETNMSGGTRFSISNGAKMFKMFSDNIYSNKIRAVLRELSTNAYDAHIDSGNADKPFDIKLPSKFDESFYIRDYGTGMSKDKLETLYTTYGESDKTRSNNAVGCFGIGSKSPFAYTDSFYIESYHNGIVYKYMAFYNEEKIPQLSECLLEQSTKEPNGLKISFTCKNDYYSFNQEANFVYQYFNVKPNFVNGEILTWPVTNVLIKESDFEILGGYQTSTKSKVVMGGIQYPIDLKICGYSVIIYANIGDVSVTLSRESIEQDKKTKAYLVQKSLEIEGSIISYVEDKIKTAATYWDACFAYYSIGITLTGKKKPQWKGKDLEKEFHIAQDEVLIKRIYVGRKGNVKHDIINYLRPSDPSMVISNFYLDDNWSPGKLKHKLNNNNGSRDIYAISFTADKDRVAFEDMTGLDTSKFPTISSLPKPPPGVSNGYRGKIGLFNNAYRYFQKYGWKDTTYNGEEGYYVFTDFGNLDGINSEQFEATLLMMTLEKDTSPIFRIPKSDRKKLLASIDTTLVRPLKEIYDELKVKYEADKVLQENVAGRQWVDRTNLEFVNKLNFDCDCLNLLKKKAVEWKKAKIDDSAFKLKKLGVIADQKIELLENLFNKYPLVNWMDKAYNYIRDDEMVKFTENEVKKQLI